MALASPTPITGSQAITPTGTGLLLYGWSFADSTGGAGAAWHVKLHLGPVGGSVIIDVFGPANGSSSDNYAHPIVFDHASGAYIEVVAGTVDGSVWWGELR